MSLSRRLAALLSVAVWLAGRVAVACSAPCQPAVSPAVDPDVPTDIGVLLTQTVDGCGDPEPLVKDVRVVDAGGQLVPGRLVTVAFRKGSIWKPHAPLIPGAAYELQETAPPGRRFPFTAGPGPAPVLDASALALVASPVLATLANVCCGESHGGSCGRDARACAASDAQNGYRLTSTVSGASSRWFQQVSLIDPDRVFTGGTVCRSATFEQAFASPILASLCLTLEAPPPGPDICGEVLVVYQGCADPGGELEAAAKRCGATSHPSDGCASAPGIGRTPPSGLHVWSGAFATAAIAALARRRGGRSRDAVRASSRG